MAEGNISIDEVIKSTPTALSSDDEAVIELGYYYLPYSTGFEIECCNKEDIPISIYKDLPYIIEAPCERDELKFRIPAGIDGLKALWHISEALKQNAMLNPNSGIHYHVDCSEVWDQFNDNLITKHSQWVLSELDTWGYLGTFNSRKCVFSESRNYTRFKNSTKTMEFRIGEMTFRYELLFKRIVHVNQIVRKIKEDTDDDIEGMYPDDLESVIKNRIIKI